MSVADYTGQAWLQGFNEVGETVFGMSANQLMEEKVRVPIDVKNKLFTTNSRTKTKRSLTLYARRQYARPTTSHVVPNRTPTM